MNSAEATSLSPMLRLVWTQFFRQEQHPLIVEHPNRIHAAACVAAEGLQQQEISAAVLAGGGSATVASAVRTAQIKFYRALRDSALANGVQSAQFAEALRQNFGVIT